MSDHKNTGDQEAMIGATSVIWGVYMIMFFGIMAFGGDNTPLYMTLITALALVSTVLIWGRDYAELFLNRSEPHKAKRSDSSADAAMMLIDLLSDDEKRDIKRRLMQSNDGEIPAIFSSEEDKDYDYS